MNIVIDKIASSTRNVGVTAHTALTAKIPAAAGTVVVARVLDDKQVYNQLEDVHGRMMTVHRGDIVAGVLGSRRALRGYAGVVPDHVAVGDTLHLLNLGGVIGLCTSANPDVGPPAAVEILGAVAQPNGCAASILPGPVGLDVRLQDDLPPLVWVVGSCMHAGKTAATCALVRDLSRRGLKVGTAKVTGVALRRDTLEMLDHGASVAYTFADAGLPSTCAGDVVAAARGCLNALGRDGVDVMVVELGDGLLGEYGVMDVLRASDLVDATTAVMLAATDPVAAWGGVELLKREGLAVTVVTGPATDNEAGCTAVSSLAGAAAVNARTAPAQLAQTVFDALFPAAQASVAPASHASQTGVAGVAAAGSPASRAYAWRAA